VKINVISNRNIKIFLELKQIFMIKMMYLTNVGYFSKSIHRFVTGLVKFWVVNKSTVRSLNYIFIYMYQPVAHLLYV